MSRILDKIFKRSQAVDLPPREDTKRLENAKQEARAQQLRKELLTREVNATLGRLQR